MPNVHLDKDHELHQKKEGKWSKYGGAVYGMVKEKIKGEWICQSCAQPQPEELKPFLYEIYEGDFIRICNLCMSIARSVSAEQSIVYYRKVVKIVKRR